MSTAPKIAVSYLRVSTSRQMETGADVDADGNSIATQREANNAKAAKIGALIQKEFVEPGASAQTIDKRPIFKQLLAYLAEHPEISLVIIYMRSRAFRNLGDAVVTKRRLESMGVKLVSAKEDFGEGIMADAMEAVTDIINEVQVRMSGEDIKAKMRHKAQMGGTNGRARIGYLNVRVEHDGRQINSIALDPERADLVRQVFELYATGDYSLDRLLEAAEGIGLTTRPTRSRPAKPLSRSQLHKLLQDPYYIGLITHEGQTFKGRHEPIVGPDLFDRVQRVVENRSRPQIRDRINVHYLKGILHCSRCHSRGRDSKLIYTESNGNGGRYEYFKCAARFDGACDLPHLPVETVEWAVADHYSTLGLQRQFLQLIREGIDAALADAQVQTRALHASYRSELTKLDQREERLLDLAADGDMPGHRIKQRLREIHIKRTAAEAGLKQTDDKLAIGARHVAQYVELLDDPSALYARADDEARRDLNTAAYERLYVDDQGVTGDIKTPIVRELHDAAQGFALRSDAERDSRHTMAGSPERTKLPGENAVEFDPTEAPLLQVLLRGGWNRGALVPPTGFEPALPP